MLFPLPGITFSSSFSTANCYSSIIPQLKCQLPCEVGLLLSPPHHVSLCVSLSLLLCHFHEISPLQNSSISLITESNDLLTNVSPTLDWPRSKHIFLYLCDCPSTWHIVWYYSRAPQSQTEMNLVHRTCLLFPADITGYENQRDSQKTTQSFMTPSLSSHSFWKYREVCLNLTPF